MNVVHVWYRAVLCVEQQVQISGVKIPWVDKMRYLGVFIVQFSLFKCSLETMLKKTFTAVLMPYLEKLEELFPIETIRCK